MDKYETFLTEHLSKQASIYYPELVADEVQVTLKLTNHRASATLYHYTIADNSQNHAVLVKMRHGHQDPKYSSKHPRRYIVDSEATFGLEHRALSDIYDLFYKQGDERFGAIRILDVLTDYQAIIMTESFAPDLRRMFVRTNRLQSLTKSHDLLPIFRNVGAWLKDFHGLPNNDDIDLCHHTRASFIKSSEQFTKHLAERIGNQAYFERLLLGISQYAEDNIPEQMPLGRTHGDFAMRNILIEQVHRVVVIDTLAKWQTAIYEDIGYFVVRLWTNQVQVFSQGLAYSTDWVQSCEQAFLKGYFGEESIPEKTIALYKILSLLDQWSALSEILSQSSSAKNKIRLSLMNRYFPKLLKIWMSQLEK